MKNRKILVAIMLLLILNFAVFNNMGMLYFSSVVDNPCSDPNILKGLSILARVISIIKVVAPALIIVTCIVQGFKGVINEDDAGTKKLVRSLIEKFIIAVFIFFIPTIINAIMHRVSGYDETRSQFTKCGACITNVNDCK